MADLPEFVDLELIDVNQRGNFGNSPLHIAATWNDCQAIELLVEHGANIHVEGEELMTPLHRAVGAGHIDATLTLLGLGANASTKDANGISPLDLARSLGRWPIVKILEIPS